MSSLEAIEPFLKKTLNTLLVETVDMCEKRAAKWLAVKGIERSKGNLIN